MFRRYHKHAERYLRTARETQGHSEHHTTLLLPVHDPVLVPLDRDRHFRQHRDQEVLVLHEAQVELVRHHTNTRH